MLMPTIYIHQTSNSQILLDAIKKFQIDWTEYENTKPKTMFGLMFISYQEYNKTKEEI